MWFRIRPKKKKGGEGEGNNGCIDKFMLYIEATFYLMWPYIIFESVQVNKVK